MCRKTDGRVGPHENPDLAICRTTDPSENAQQFAYLGVHPEEGVRASAAPCRSFKGLAVIKMIVIIQVPNLQSKQQIVIG